MEQINIEQLSNRKYNDVKKIFFEDENKKVILVENKNNKQRFIIKEIKLSNLNEKEKTKSKNEEARLLQLKHPNILKYYKSKIKNNKIVIVFEYEEGGDLLNKIKNQKNKYFKEQQIIDWFIEICDTIKYVHSKKCIYRDLRPENIFLNKDNHVKLSNFSISKLLIKKNEENQYYLSPEIIKHQTYDSKSDIWNLGIILYQLTQLKHPFEDNITSYQKKIDNILEGKYFYFSNNNYSETLLNLIKNSLKVNPNERISIDQIIYECYKIKNEKNFIFKNE